MIWNRRSARLIEFLFHRKGLRMLTACCQQGLSITGTTLQLKGFAMMCSRVFAVHAGLSPLWRLQAWAIERLVSILSPSGDLRWAIAALAIALLAALEAMIHRQLVSLARNTMRRALQGARFAGQTKADDSMVAAARR
jgi:hypothetical protein